MKPIFIFGCDRSGTTLLGSLLGSHSRSVVTPESQFVYDVYRSEISQHGSVDVFRAAQKIRENFRFQLWNIDFSDDELRAAGVSTYPELIIFLVKTYAAATGKADADIWSDHTPANCASAITLKELFPEAQFVHIVRDGRAVAASLLALPWKFHDAKHVAEYWLRRLAQGFAAESHFGPALCRRVRYEDLVLDNERYVRELCAFSGLDFEASMLSGRGFKVPKYTSKEHALVGKPADTQRINAWEKKLSARNIELFEYFTGDMLPYLNYELKYGTTARKQTRYERYRAGLLDILFYRRYDGFKERAKRKKTLGHLREQGYLNRQPSRTTDGVAMSDVKETA